MGDLKLVGDETKLYQRLVVRLYKNKVMAKFVHVPRNKQSRAQRDRGTVYGRARGRVAVPWPAVDVCGARVFQACAHSNKMARRSVMNLAAENKT